MAKNKKGLRALTWDDYGISADRQKELKWFCRQYRSKRRKAHSRDYALAAVNYERLTVGSSGLSSPTEAAAIRNYSRAERALRDCRIIEEAAMWAADSSGYKIRNLWRAILKNVTEGTGYDALLAHYDISFLAAPDFYSILRLFYYRLDQLQYEAQERDQEAEGGEDHTATRDKADDRGGGTST